MDVTLRGAGAAERRSLLRGVFRGLVSRCPRCGSAPLFASWLKPVECCDRCGQDFREQRADDLPPYVVIFVVGHLVVAGYLLTERLLPSLSAWAQLAIWVPVTLLLSIALIRPVKGGTIGLQWGLGMLDPEPERSDDPTERFADGG